MPSLSDIDERSRLLFKELVETYLDTGEPVGSRTLSRRDGVNVSPATIRNVMADLTEFGLLEAPHTSAGRQPTERGLRLFVDGMLEVGKPTADERRALEEKASLGDPQTFKKDLGRIHPVGRTGTPADIAGLAAWLASDEAAFVTGQIWTVDGGRMSKLSLP